MAAVVSAVERRRMDGVVAGLPTKAAKIRALGRAGYSRTQIAKYLGIKYQHVRHVLVRSSRDEPLRETTVAQLGPGGRFVIPAPYRRALHLKTGDKVVLRLGDGELQVLSRTAAIRRAQEIVARYVSKDVSLVDELIAERRREAEREERGE